MNISIRLESPRWVEPLITRFVEAAEMIANAYKKEL